MSGSPFDGEPGELPDPLTVLARRRGPNGWSCPFGVCDGSGFVIDAATNTASDCACRRGRIAAARAATLEGRVPNRYRGVCFERPPVLGMPEAIVAEVRRYVRNLEPRLAEGRGLWLTGDVGTGKTSLAMIVSKAALDAGRSVAIYSLPRLLNLIRDEIGAENSLLDLLDSLSAVDLLHIDDLGAQHTTPWRLEQLYSIVDARYQAKRAIIATTHLMPDELAEQMGRRVLASAPDADARQQGRERASLAEDAGEVVGKRIVSRLVEMCGDPLPLYGADMRREFRAARAHSAEPAP
ncbi:MAG TPA: ATP-binding protein [Solirubrobacteraceae bacterium]|nr:ATP-binding protein [Solirubrobacteraceae bacterium]